MKTQPHSEKNWSVSEAKSRLSEILRRARKDGPQYIGKREQCVLISKEEWEAHVKPKESLSAWLLNHSPDIKLTIPERGQSTSRQIPFAEDPMP